MRAMYASGECNACERQVAKTAGAMYANDRNHDEDGEMDGDKRQPLLTTWRQ